MSRRERRAAEQSIWPPEMFADRQRRARMREALYEMARVVADEFEDAGHPPRGDEREGLERACYLMRKYTQELGARGATIGFGLYLVDRFAVPKCDVWRRVFAALRDKEPTDAPHLETYDVGYLWAPGVIVRNRSKMDGIPERASRLVIGGKDVGPVESVRDVGALLREHGAGGE